MSTAEHRTLRFVDPGSARESDIIGMDGRLQRWEQDFHSSVLSQKQLGPIVTTLHSQHLKTDTEALDHAEAALSSTKLNPDAK